MARGEHPDAEQQDTADAGALAAISSGNDDNNNDNSNKNNDVI